MNPNQANLVGTFWQGCIPASHPNALNQDCRVTGEQGCSESNDTPLLNGYTPGVLRRAPL
jgi:hypothetical protein